MLNLFKKFINFVSFVFKGEKQIRKYIMITILLTLCMSILTMSLPIIFSRIIALLSNKDSSLVFLLPYILLGYGFLWLSSHLIENIRSIVTIYFLEGSMRAVSLSLFDHLHTLSMRFHTSKQSGAIMNSINRAQYGLDTLFFGGLLFALPLLLEMTILFIIITYWYGLWSIVLLCVAFLYIFIQMKFLKKTEQLHKEYNVKRSQVNGAILDSLINIETVKIFNNQQLDHEKIKTLLAEQETAGIVKHSADAKLNAAQSLIIGCIFLLVTFVTGTAVQRGSYTITDFILINSYLMQFFVFLRSAHMIQQIRKGLYDIAFVDDLLSLKPEIEDHHESTTLQAKDAAIVFDRVTFGYDEQRLILKNISFAVPAGKTIAIVGPSGAGKSTLARLLFRFYDVTEGSIRINGEDIKMISRESLHKTLGLVPQNTPLFNNTLRFNIVYGNPHANLSELDQAAKNAQLDRFVAGLSKGYDTEVGEQGLKLSGGEKQRVAIARVLLKKPLIYIFDEATSSLDSHTEKEIQDTIRTISSQATTFIIAHRLSTITHADSIIVLNEGRIAEQGTHAELLARDGLYAQLWSMQIKSSL